MMGAIMTDKGQVTLPRHVRDRLGLTPGSMVEFDLDLDGRIVVRKGQAESHPGRFEQVRGTATAGLTTEEIMSMTRGED